MSTVPSSTPRREAQRASHLREVSNGSPNSVHNIRPVTATSDTGTVQQDPALVKAVVQRRCILWVHEDAFSKEEVILNLDLFPGLHSKNLMAILAPKNDADTLHTVQEQSNPTRSSRPINSSDSKFDADLGSHYLFMSKDMPGEMKSKQPHLEISVAKHIADLFCLKHRSNVLVTTTDTTLNSASHVELSFKDEYLARSDMWRLALGELCKRTVFRGQKILFMGTIKAQITSIYVNGCSVQSAFFSTNTKPIFRSGSARYVLFIQMSREMWDFDSEGSGEIMFNKVINGFLPALFKKWAYLKVKHLVSIVLFTRVEYDTGMSSELATDIHDSTYHTGVQTDGNKRPYKDFYRVVVSEMASGSWTTILYQLKREFKFFRKDISMHRIDIVNTLTSPPVDSNMRGALGTRIEAEPSLAMHGNVLEAISLAASQFAQDYIDRDLMRTGISIVVITPSPGLFEVDYETLRMTTETLIGNGIGIDLVCLPKMPLHSVPLFRYRNPQYATFQEALHFKSFLSEDSTPRQNGSIFGSSFSTLNESLSPTKGSQSDRGFRTGSFAANNPPSEWSYAIPHWIDVSFWTGASQENHTSSSSARRSFRYVKTANNQHMSEFAVRCKMYEMEMASVMENTLTEIAVLPLRNDAFYPQMMTGPRDVPCQKVDRKDTSYTGAREKPYICLFESISGPTKPLFDRHTPPDSKRVLQALDLFDCTRSENVAEDHKSRQYNESKRYFKTGSEEAAMKLLAEDPKVFGTSFTDGLGTLKNASFISRSLSGRNKKLSSSPEEPFKATRKTTTKSLAADSQPPIRPPKFGRQISLGKHGFGIAAPKAATAELQTQHANATQLTSSNSHVLSSKSKTSAMSNSFLGSSGPQVQTRPPSSQSERLNVKASDPIIEPNTPSDGRDGDKTLSSRPMTIKSALQNLDSTNQVKSRSVLGSLYEVSNQQLNRDSSTPLHSMRPDDTQKLYNSKLLAGSVPELPTTLSPTTALSPWLSVLNPSNPSLDALLGPSQYSRWQHVFPRPLLAKTMKWKSLCSPASIPLTTEYFPTKYQLDTEYQQKPYSISQNIDEELQEIPKSREDFLRELIGLRLSQGFQVVVGPGVAEAFGQKSLKIAHVFDPDCIAEDGASVFMSMGTIIHQLSCVNDSEVEIKMFVRKPTAPSATSPGFGVPAIYNPAIRTTLAEQYHSRQIILGKSRDEYNWNYVDAFIAGFDETMSDSLRFWRARFVLIPVERPTQSQRRQGEDNEEEIRLEGIRKLTFMWQKHRIITASERRFQSLASRKIKDVTLNPLEIVYRTEDPSIVVTQELETLPLIETGESGARKGQLIETERFRKSKLDISALAEAIQAPVEKGGIRMQNRRWHFRLHYNCFIGSDMTAWLIENFEDIGTREEAVELGNMLMAKDELQKIKEKETAKDNGKERDMGIFCHVEKRHPFRDGQYFYQVTGEFSKQRPESRSGWFNSKRRDTSVPSTPLSESMIRDSPRPERSGSSSNHDDRSSDSGTTTPTTSGGPTGKKQKVALSKVMKYDVDHRKRSYRPERINLHYDRLHNPDNCYHIRIDWMSVTAKLIEDAIESWATTAERYGLRLVEAPIGEACSIVSVHPFRSPYTIELATQPPEQQPRTYFDVNSFAPQVQSSPASRHYYQKAIMKKFNFVLDIEAARNFPTNIDVTYSWGRPDFKYSQYIHRSGVLFAQITDDGNFLLLANRLYNNRTSAIREWDKFVKNDHLDRSRMVSSVFGGHGITSDKPTPVNSPLLHATSTNISSPLLRTTATSDVLGPSLADSKLASNTTPETIKTELEAFCKSHSLLEIFYKEVFEKATPPSATPPTLTSPSTGVVGLDSSIPTLGLPPGILARDASPGPLRLGAFGRRPSVQAGTSVNSSGSGERQDSPRESIAAIDEDV